RPRCGGGSTVSACERTHCAVRRSDGIRRARHRTQLGVGWVDCERLPRSRCTSTVHDADMCPHALAVGVSQIDELEADATDVVVLRCLIATMFCDDTAHVYGGLDQHPALLHDAEGAFTTAQR